jgi:uncharacterized protein (DUF1501 family)
MHPKLQVIERNQSRRSFLKTGLSLSVAGAAAPLAMNLAALSEAAAASSALSVGDDYKAIVCVFMYGGNDYANTLIPFDAPNHAAYNSFRSNLAIQLPFLTDTLLKPATPLVNSRQYALAPELSSLIPIFDAAQMSVILNVGTLIQPTTKAQFTGASVPLPPKLFSHNDQQSYWQSTYPEGATSGWGGRMGDLFQSSNSKAAFTCIGLGGKTVYLTGKYTSQYQLSSSGSVQINGIKTALFGSSACQAALNKMIVSSSNHLLEQEYIKTTSRSIDAHDQVSLALSKTNPLTTTFPIGNSLSDQLQVVAKLIAARSSLGVKRQVFFVSIGGFDLHAGLTKYHPGLMQLVGEAMSSFYKATVELGVSQQVSTFTASDFGRTLLSNSDGSDHGWGSMHFVMGGAVKGQKYIGAAPAVANSGPDDVGQGRLLPSISVDQVASTLATWFGVSAQDQLSILPNLKNFSQKDLGFFI